MISVFFGALWLLVFLPLLTTSNSLLVRRGRNTKSHKAPKNTDIITYKAATGFEALIGYLYLQNNTKRINEIIEEIIGD